MATVNEATGLIDEIRAFINSPDQTADDRLATLAEQYSDACRQANERLTRCGDFLERGLRSQAIELAEAEPDLLRTVALLNFVEIDEWQEVAASYGWPRFQPLKMEIASAISEAYAIEENLGGLLRKHRHLALARASVKDRLSIMRQIATVDVTAQFWQEDIAEFERERFKELTSLAQQARQSKDLEVVADFVSHYDDEEWTTTPPVALAREHVQLAQYLYETSVLPEMAQEICDAYTNMDVAKLSDLIEQWNATTDYLRQLNPRWVRPTNLAPLIDPAFAYLEEAKEQQAVDDYRRDVAKLDRTLTEALQRDRRVSQLDTLLAKAESHGYALPATTQQALEEYNSRIAEAKMLNLGVIIALAVAGVGALVFGFFMIQAIIGD